MKEKALNFEDGKGNQNGSKTKNEHNKQKHGGKIGKGKGTLLTKILLYIGIPILAAYGVSSFITLNTVNKTITDLTTKQLVSESEAAAKDIGGRFNEYLKITETMAQSSQLEDVVLELQPGMTADLAPSFKRAENSLASVKAMEPETIIEAWVADVDTNQLVLSNGYFSSPDWVAIKRPWFIQMAEANAPTMTSPYLDALTGKLVVTAVTPIYREGTNEIIGAAGLDFLLDGISATIAGYQLGKTGYFILADSTGQIIYHPSKDYLNTNVKDADLSDNVKDAILGHQTGSIEYTDGNQEIHGYLSAVGATGWTVATALPNQEFHSTYHSLQRLTLGIIFAVLLIIGVMIVAVSRRIVTPVRQLAFIAHKLAVGDVDVETNRVKAMSSELDELAGAFTAMADNIREQSKAAERIAAGDLSVQIQARSEKDVLGFSMASVIETLKNLIEEAGGLNAAAASGKLETRGDTERFSGGYREIISGINSTLDALIKPLKLSANYIERISKGDIPEKIEEEYRGDFNEIRNDLNQCIEAIQALVEDAGELASAAQDGRLQVRADGSKHGGDFRRIVEGFNGTLDSVINPLTITAGYIQQIGNGSIPGKITDTFHGDFNELKESINACIDGLGGLKESRDVLKKMSVNDYSVLVRGEYKGIFEEIASSVNGVSDRVKNSIRIINNVSIGNLEDLSELRVIGRRSDNDTLVPALVTMMENIKALVEETATLSEASIQGRLTVRGNTGRFEGEFEKIIEGINRTMDAVIEPINEAAGVLEQMAEGHLNVLMEGNYQGDYAKIKEALNATIGNLQAYIGELSHVLSKIGEGNLQLAIESEYKGNFVEIKNSLNGIISSLSEVFGNIGEAANQVNAGARQVSDGSQTLSQGSTEQASSVEELSASISEIASQTKQNAVNANLANELASEAKEFAQKGNAHMKEMLNSMEEINASSANISKIIKVIDDIAFQTNILALNAAVEAARAGLHGKGFAVVAEEVRNLAARSAKAVKETSELIEGSAAKASAGTKIAKETAEALDGIVAKVGEAADLVSDIAEASNVQATGIAQINKGIEQVSMVIQNNSATAEESAAASEELSSQSEYLREMVGTFQIKGLAAPAQNKQLSAPVHSKGVPVSELKRRQSPPTILLGGESDKY
ncbi:MAG: methyl-accepting chemotaxis protein signaling domain protein [Bacillota bacterium]|nr:methyl-accepting chemotaxis protein signaling domain protein [Bacillota bacterium]